MTTPPLDLPDMRAHAVAAENLKAGAHITNAELLALLDRVEEADGLLARLSASGGRNIDLLTRAEAAERDLAAVTVSRDGWQTRAEAAEKKVAAVEALHSSTVHTQYAPEVCQECDHRYPCPTITALDTHTPETETTP